MRLARHNYYKKFISKQDGGDITIQDKLSKNIKVEILTNGFPTSRHIIYSFEREYWSSLGQVRWNTRK